MDLAVRIQLWSWKEIGEPAQIEIQGYLMSEVHLQSLELGAVDADLNPETRTLNLNPKP